MRAGLIQLRSGDVPAENLPATEALIHAAASAGARLILTPEVTNCVSGDRSHQRDVLQTEDNDLTLAALRDLAKALEVWIAVGSLALKIEGEDRFANRSFLISPNGAVTARYDKIHMFDVEVSATETYRESAGYRPGDRAVTATVDDLTLGLTICYDVRFPSLYRCLAQSGAQVITVPSAFSQVTGTAHWEPLLRARAIETGSYVLAAAQCGEHPTSTKRVRKTYGHSLAVAPWGEVVADGGTEPGFTIVDLDAHAVTEARRRVPSLRHDRHFEGP